MLTLSDHVVPHRVFDLCSTERFMQKKKTKSPTMTAAKNILITAAYFLICV